MLMLFQQFWLFPWLSHLLVTPQAANIYLNTAEPLPKTQSLCYLTSHMIHSIKQNEQCCFVQAKKKCFD